MSLGNRNNKQNQQQSVANTDREQITALSRNVFMIYGASMVVSILALGWKAYDPAAWLPMPNVGTFLVLVGAFTVMWFLWLQRIYILDKGEKK